MDTCTNLVDHGGANAYLRSCPSRTVLDVLSDKWTTLVVGALGDEPKRFTHLRRQLDGITQKMLTQTLRSLERDGFVTRTQYPTIPPRVEYDLTEMGRNVKHLLDALREWSEQHIHQILEARAAYDSRDAAQVD